MAGEECGSEEVTQNKSKKGLVGGRMQAEGAVNGKRRRVEDRPGIWALALPLLRGR